MSGRVNRALRCLALLPGHRRSAAGFCSTQFETDSEDNLYNEDEASKDKNFSRSATYNTFGLYKAVLVGQVGFGPFEKILGDGRALTLFSIGTSGLIRPPNYPEQIQWHKVAVYPERLREIARQISKGRRVYLEGNMEVRIFNDYVTGAVKQIREISVRPADFARRQESPEKAYASHDGVHTSCCHKLSARSLSRRSTRR
ncbi:single-stranded DNA-binding protein, mitochondrial-like isoform X2 [Selaginella moellendorffii]|uniref:single-stranded DNA-binding protein, mitochondrial-like isoform X2 n=1 Tax=Selaginella moellendorffii TaxID=88036 RepID=UPI000D1C2105|nr:single-stranded DNA-binding protein, mitochondrial-like isoform X2 [Selaginella moellendorffii]|eukprot:XP_024536301.1 single-stranded DNA-binding protein, mitochondrial-like isoform X2 [Selaginella moellendorffii]